jgi:hypothetical protein
VCYGATNFNTYTSTVGSILAMDVLGYDEK